MDVKLKLQQWSQKHAVSKQNVKPSSSSPSQPPVLDIAINKEKQLALQRIKAKFEKNAEQTHQQEDINSETDIKYCIFCNKKFVNDEYLKMHMISSHNEENEFDVAYIHLKNDMNNDNDNINNDNHDSNWYSNNCDIYNNNDHNLRKSKKIYY
jgi:hypothetical protein